MQLEEMIKTLNMINRLCEINNGIIKNLERENRVQERTIEVLKEVIDNKQEIIDELRRELREERYDRI